MPATDRPSGHVPGGSAAGSAAVGTLPDIPEDWIEIGPRDSPPPADLLSWTEMPVEGWVADTLADLPLSDCSDAELLDVVAAWEQLASWVAGNQARVITEFSTRRPREPEPETAGRYVFSEEHDQDPDVDDSAADELSLALRVAPVTAAHRMDFARELSFRLPRTLSGMCSGTVTVSKARIMSHQSAALDAEQTAELERRVLRGCTDQTPGRFRRRVHREVLRIDAEAVHRRAEKANAERKVRLIPLPDGVAELRCTLPGLDAVAAYNWLDQHARAAKADGDPRTLNQLRADALVELVRARSTAVARRPLIQVLVPITTMAGSAHPGELAGYGPIDADLARQLAADGSWQRLLTDPSGGIVHVGQNRYRPPAALKAFVQARDRTCRFPTCYQPAHRCDIDHTIRYGTIKNATRSDNLGVLCRRHHRLKDQPGTHWSLRQDTDGRFLWTTPAGNTFAVRPDPPDLQASLEPDADVGPEPPLEAALDRTRTSRHHRSDAGPAASPAVPRHPALRTGGP